MRVPYTVGRWVRGEQHYGRQRLITHLLTATDNEFWLIGTRRMGKTSLLRQMEMVAVDRDDFVPLFCDLQGCQSSDDVALELSFAVEDAAERFTPLGVNPDDVVGLGAVETLRYLQRAAARHDRQLLLLVDEAEALIHVAEQEDRWLARLRRVFQDERQRTVMTATKILSRLNDLQSEWMTSPFLFGFNLVNLWSLDTESAAALVRQSQAAVPVEVDDGLLTEILHCTNRHPYLMQFLCQRLYSTDGQCCWLRPVKEEDLLPDHLLAKFLEIDFNHLASLERRILLIVGAMPAISLLEILKELSDESPSRIRTFVYGLHKLGYIREDHDQWFISNDFLAHWLHDHRPELEEAVASELNDAQLERLIARGADQERFYLQREAQVLQRKLDDLTAAHASVDHEARTRLQHEIDHTRRELEAVRDQLRLLNSATTA